MKPLSKAFKIHNPVGLLILTQHPPPNSPSGTSLVAQWLRLCAPNAGGPGSIPGQGTRSHVHAATKSSHATTRSSHATTKEPMYRN